MFPLNVRGAWTETGATGNPDVDVDVLFFSGRPGSNAGARLDNVDIAGVKDGEDDEVFAVEGVDFRDRRRGGFDDGMVVKGCCVKDDERALWLGFCVCRGGMKFHA